MRVWNVASGECERTLEGHGLLDHSPLLLSNGRLVGAGSEENTVRVWNIATGVCEQTLRGHTQWITSVAALADGRIVSGSRDRTLRVWNAATGECLRTLEGHTKSVTSVVALKDGRIVSGATDSTLRVWSFATGECERTMNEHASDVDALAVLADGHVLSFCRPPEKLSVWRVDTGECVRVLPVRGWCFGIIETMTVLPGERVLTCAIHGEVSVLDAATGACEQVHRRRSAAASALLTAPRLETPGTVHHLSGFDASSLGGKLVLSGSKVVDRGFAPMYVDASTTAILALTTSAAAAGGESRAVTTVVVGTSTGAVHFFTVHPPCSST